MQTFYRWRKEFGDQKLDRAKRLKGLERENRKLKRLVAELCLEKQVLRNCNFRIVDNPEASRVAGRIGTSHGSLLRIARLGVKHEADWTMS